MSTPPSTLRGSGPAPAGFECASCGSTPAETGKTLCVACAHAIECHGATQADAFMVECKDDGENGCRGEILPGVSVPVSHYTALPADDPRRTDFMTNDASFPGFPFGPPSDNDRIRTGRKGPQGRR